MVMTGSKKKKLENRRNENFDEIPLDLLMEILGRLPAKSVARFLLVSKSWARIIRSRQFITSYPFGSCSSQPRVLIAFMDKGRQRGGQHLYTFSQSLSSTSSLPSCAAYPLPSSQRGHSYLPLYVNGLISLGYGKEQFILNPSTGRSLDLPKPNVETRDMVHRQLINSFFGYDSVNDQYKVLCMVNLYASRQLQPSTQHQVLTLGAKNSWRMINCSIPHSPVSYGQICIDGVVYYFANTGADLSQLSLMTFDLKSEKLDLFTSLSADIKVINYHHPMTLINYKGKVAIPIYKTSEHTFEVWVIDQYANNHGWLKVISFSVKPGKTLDIIGTTHGSGEFILAPLYHCDDFNVILYNPDTNSVRNAKVEVNEDYEYKCRSCKRAIVFPDYVECIRLL